MSGVRRAFLVALLAAVIPAATPVWAQDRPGYDIIKAAPDGLELRFHGMPLRSVHADDSQNALALDFHQPVDGMVFDRLAGELPQWIAMAYANFDNGIIRSARPVTFLAHAESDGFSLRLIPRDAPPAAAEAPPIRGSLRDDPGRQP